MTNNQIALKQAKETERSNKAKEKETERSNRAKEKEMYRSNRTNERLQRTKQTVGTLTDAAKIVTAFANDISWYNDDPQLLKDVASLSFNNPLGNVVKTSVDPNTRKPIIPGICVLSYYPTVGSMGRGGKGGTADIAAKSLYAYVRHANSGSRNYEAVDLMQYVLAVGDAAAYHAYLCRVYSLVMTSKTHNRYYVDGMLKAVGVDPDDIRMHIADLRAYINSFAIRLNSFAIPKGVHLIKRRVWMNSYIFKDSPVKKSQEYMYVQRNFLRYDDENGQLVYTAPDSYPGTPNFEFVPNAANLFTQLKWRGDLIIKSLVDSEDAGIMSGDIMKAYGESNLFYIAPINEDYHIESIYDTEVLSQIENTTSYNFGDDASLFHITQQDGYIRMGKPLYLRESDVESNVVDCYGFPVQTSISDRINLDNQILNFNWDDVKPEDVMIATRNMVGGGKYVINAVDGTKLCITEFGSEIFVNNYFCTLNNNIPSDMDILQLRVYKLAGNVGEVNDYMSIYTKFSHAPKLISITNNETDSAGLEMTTLNNYSNISRITLDNLHYVAVLSEFGIPKLGLTVRTRN